MTLKRRWTSSQERWTAFSRLYDVNVVDDDDSDDGDESVDSKFDDDGDGKNDDDNCDDDGEMTTLLISGLTWMKTEKSQWRSSWRLVQRIRR